MRITRLRLRGVRRHRDLDLELAPGLTVVRGPNEAGKTTIQRAIELGLTRRVTSASADLDGVRNWAAAPGSDDAVPIVEMEFEQEDDEIVRTGHLEKVFRGAKGTVRLRYGEEEIGDPAAADQRLADLTGIPTEAFFRSTASVRHHEVDDLARDEAALRDRLQASISGGDRGTSRARKVLERAIRDLTSRGTKNPGRLKAAEAEVESARAAAEQGELALAQLERDRLALAEAVARRAEAGRELETRRSMLEKARQAERLESERAAASERFERYRSAAEVLTRLQDARAAHPSTIPISRLRELVEALRRVDGRIRELRAQLSGEIEVEYEPPPSPRSWRGTLVAAAAVIVAGIGLAGGAVSFAELDWAFLPGLGIAALGVGLLLIARRLQLRYEQLRMGHEMREIDIDRRLRGRSLLQQELVDRELEAADLLRSLELDDLEAAEALLESEQAHVALIGQLDAQLTGLVGTIRPEAIVPERNAAALEIERKTHALEELGPIAREPRARERLEVEAREAEAHLDRERDAEARARASVDSNRVDAEEVAASVERLALAEERLASHQRRHRVCVTTLTAIEAAERSTMRTATRYLERSMVGDIERITGGRYRRVRVDDASLAIEVFAPERGDWVDVSVLSQGTLDLIYLAARLGLVRLVTGDRRPPLVFDDPFVTLDDDRAARAMELLREIARDFQIIYLTTSDRYDRSADAVRILPGPVEHDERSDGDGAIPTVAG